MQLYIASIALIGISVFIIARSIFSDEEAFRATEALDDEAEKSTKKEDKDFVLKYSRPFFKRYVSPIVSTMKNKKEIRKKFRKKLANGGLLDTLSPEDFYSFKLFLIFGFPILYVVVNQFGELGYPLSFAPITGVVGYFYPDIWLSGKIDKRKKDMIMAMPFIVDLLALSVEAGLDFLAAMTRVVEKAPHSPLVEEFETVIKETKIGSSRAESLRGLAWRSNIIEISSFSATLIAADSVGASIGPILKTLSGEMRQRRSSQIEELGAKAATKILLPLMIIVGSVFIVLFGPVFLEWRNSQ